MKAISVVSLCVSCQNTLSSYAFSDPVGQFPASLSWAAHGKHVAFCFRPQLLSSFLLVSHSSDTFSYNCRHTCMQNAFVHLMSDKVSSTEESVKIKVLLGFPQLYLQFNHSFLIYPTVSHPPVPTQLLFTL